LEVSRVSAARYVLNLNEGAVSWYKKYGFQEIPGGVGPGRQKKFFWT
jgi:hypothetical protein